MAEMTAAEAEALLREQVASWQGFYRQYLAATNGDRWGSTGLLMELIEAGSQPHHLPGVLAMAVRLVQEGPDLQPGPDAVEIDPIPGHPEFEAALDHMYEGLARIVEHGEVHIAAGEPDSENIACTYNVLMKTLSRAEMAGLLSGAVTVLAHLGWRP